jgi:proteasome accessory factor A
MVRSPKALATRALVSSESAHRRPFLLLREETHAEPGWRRLQVPFADGNATPMGTWLKVGTTHLALRLVEEEVLGYDYELQSPLGALFDVSGVVVSPDGTRASDVPVVLADGFTTTALGLQREYADRVEALLGRNGGTDEEWQVLRAWRSTIVGLQDGTSDYRSMPEWQLKYELMQRHSARRGYDITSPEAKRYVDSFSSVNPNESLVARLIEQGILDGVVSADEIGQAMHTPPATRAQSRGAVVDLIGDLSATRRSFLFDEIRCTVVADWSQAMIIPINRKHGEVVSVEFGDPRSPSPGAVDRFRALLDNATFDFAEW